MRLYHGSHIEVRTPRVLTTSRSGDFGRGFYTTTSLEQARRWAQIRAEREELSSGVVSTFEVPDSIIEHPALSVKTFAKADSQWLDFVMSNRMDTRFEHQFDLVYGPVANDRVYVCLNALENGTADRASVLRRLRTYVLADQILFHTEKSLLFLDFVQSEVVSCRRK